MLIVYNPYARGLFNEVLFAAGVHAVDWVAACVQVAVQRSRVGVAAHQRVLGQEAPVARVVVPGPQEVQAACAICLPVELVGVWGRSEAVGRVAEGIVGIGIRIRHRPHPVRQRPHATCFKANTICQTVHNPMDLYLLV